MINQPKTYTLDGALVEGDFVMVSIPLPAILPPDVLVDSEEYRAARISLQKQMAERGWVEGDVPVEESRTLRGIHVDQIVDYSMRDGQPTLFLAAVGYQTGKPLFVERNQN